MSYNSSDKGTAPSVKETKPFSKMVDENIANFNSAQKCRAEGLKITYYFVTLSQEPPICSQGLAERQEDQRDHGKPEFCSGLRCERRAEVQRQWRARHGQGCPQLHWHGHQQPLRKSDVHSFYQITHKFSNFSVICTLTPRVGNLLTLNLFLEPLTWNAYWVFPHNRPWASIWFQPLWQPKFCTA